MKGFLKYIISGFLSGLMLVACVEKQDFDQYETLLIQPVFESSILYIEVPERIINAVTQTNFYAQEFNYDAFSEDIFAERVLSGVVTYVVENTTSKQLDILVEFLDENGGVLDQEPFSLQPAPTAVLDVEIAYGPTGRSLDIIRNTSSIRVSATNNSGTSSTSNSPDPKVTLKSSGKFKVNI